MTSFVVCGQQLCAAKNCNTTGLSQKAFASGSNIVIRNKQSNQIRRSMKTVSAAAATDKIPPRPDASGRYGQFGGKYVPETLIAALEELEKAYADAMADEAFKVSFDPKVTGDLWWSWYSGSFFCAIACEWVNHQCLFTHVGGIRLCVEGLRRSCLSIVSC
jgi:hypothetical protein